MKKIHKKYSEDFNKLQRDWQRLQKAPSQQGLKLVVEDLQELAYDLKNMNI